MKLSTRQLGMIAGGGLGLLLLIGIIWHNHGGSVSFFDDSNTAGDTANLIVTTTTPIGEQQTAELNPGSKKGLNQFHHKVYDFSFEYPVGYTVGSFSEGEAGETVLVQNKNSNAKSTDGFQIAINPFDEQITLTPERIKKDLPDQIVNNPKNIALADGKVTALSFEGSDSSFGKSREIWFVYGGQLYQVKSHLEFTGDLEDILKTLQFN